MYRENTASFGHVIGLTEHYMCIQHPALDMSWGFRTYYVYTAFFNDHFISIMDSLLYFVLERFYTGLL